MKKLRSLFALFYISNSIAALPPQVPAPTSVKAISGEKGWVMGNLSLVGINKAHQTVVWRCTRSKNQCILLLCADLRKDGKNQNALNALCTPLKPYHLPEGTVSHKNDGHKYMVGIYVNGKLTFSPADEIKADCSETDVILSITTY